MKKISVAVIVIMITMFAGTAAAVASTDLTGKVIETMDSGGYTYAQIENNGKKTWVAVPRTKIEKGSTVTFLPGAPMMNFTSKSLGKTFDTIIFSTGLAE
jgi:hypothetical protein